MSTAPTPATPAPTCADCGVPTPDAEPATIEQMPLVGAPSASQIAGVRPRVFPTVPTALCATCAARHDHAARLVEDHRPMLRARVGSLDLARHRVAAALGALTVVGRPAPAIPPGVEGDRALALLLHHFLAVGVAVRWAAPHRMVPGPTPPTPADEPWAHVETDLRAEITRAVSDWLAARIGRVRQVPPPTLRGCGGCGVGSLPCAPTSHPEDADVWGSPYRLVPLAALGTPSSRGPVRRPDPDEYVTMHLCPACRDALSRAHNAVGPTWLETAAGTFFETRRGTTTGLPQWSPDAGLVAWAALEVLTPGNPLVGVDLTRQPWSHLPRPLVRALREYVPGSEG